MEERNDEMIQEEEGYTPRPMWQVWAARAGVVLMIFAIIYQVLQILGGFGA